MDAKKIADQIVGLLNWIVTNPIGFLRWIVGTIAITAMTSTM